MAAPQVVRVAVGWPTCERPRQPVEYPRMDLLPQRRGESRLVGVPMDPPGAWRHPRADVELFRQPEQSSLPAPLFR